MKKSSCFCIAVRIKIRYGKNIVNRKEECVSKDNFRFAVPLLKAVSLFENVSFLIHSQIGSYSSIENVHLTYVGYYHTDAVK